MPKRQECFSFVSNTPQSKRSKLIPGLSSLAETCPYCKHKTPKFSGWGYLSRFHHDTTVASIFFLSPPPSPWSDSFSAFCQDNSANQRSCCWEEGGEPRTCACLICLCITSYHHIKRVIHEIPFKRKVKWMTRVLVAPWATLPLDATFTQLWLLGLSDWWWSFFKATGSLWPFPWASYASLSGAETSAVREMLKKKVTLQYKRAGCN